MYRLNEAVTMLSANLSSKQPPETVLRYLNLADRILSSSTPVAIKAFAHSRGFLPRVEKVALVGPVREL